MKCLNCNDEMIKGTVEGVGQGAGSFYEFTADEEKKKIWNSWFLYKRDRFNFNPNQTARRLVLSKV